MPQPYRQDRVPYVLPPSSLTAKATAIAVPRPLQPSTLVTEPIAADEIVPQPMLLSDLPGEQGAIAEISSLIATPTHLPCT
ncbi:hypothetical protein ACP70R_041417 [Stipagrostis hirtigluma subsp. patula]